MGGCKVLDKHIHKHLDDQESIEISIEDDIDSLIDSIDIFKLLKSPEVVLQAIVEDIKSNIENKYAKQSIENGINFAEDIIKAKSDIKINITENAELNKDDVSKGRGKSSIS
jgi:hypothetical protein